MFEIIHGRSDHDLCAKDAKIGDATRSPTMNAEDITPSSKFVKSKSPLHIIWLFNKIKAIQQQMHSVTNVYLMHIYFLRRTERLK